MKEIFADGEFYLVATCSGCFNRHDPEMCPFGDFDGNWECTHGHFNCTKH